MTASQGLWLLPGPLILASGSETRRALLESAGIPVEAHPAALDERGIENALVEAGQGPGGIARHLAREKALAVSRGRPGALVLGGDQTLALGERRFHKPPDLAAAAAQLAALAGRTHSLHSGLALVRDGAVVFETVVRADLAMRALSSAFVAHYLAAAGPRVCASVGAYQVEALGIHLFERIEGDHSTVLGLPLLPLLAALRRLGALAE